MRRAAAQSRALRGARGLCSGGIGEGTRRFANPAFWDAKYKSGRAPREWFATADGVLGAVDATLRHEPALREAESIACLHVGCGLSELGIRVAQIDPRVHVTNVDTSEAAVEGLERRAREGGFDEGVLARNVFAKDDVLSSRFAPASFDMCVDKGTLDAVEFAGDAQVARFLACIHELLRPGGLYLQISTVDPGIRDAVTLADVPWGRVTWASWTSDRDNGRDEDELWVYKFTKA